MLPPLLLLLVQQQQQLPVVTWSSRHSIRPSPPPPPLPLDPSRTRWQRHHEPQNPVGCKSGFHDLKSELPVKTTAGNAGKAAAA
jgi:hypothetical protein